VDLVRRAVVVMAVVGCSGKTVAITELRDKFIAATCANAVTCQQLPDLATCNAVTTYDDNYLATRVALVQAKAVHYDGEAAARWIDAIAAHGCDTAAQTDTDSARFHIFSGTVALGGDCLIDDQCAGDGSFCQPADPTCSVATSCCPGTCVAGAAKSAYLGPCNTSSDCADNLYCSASSYRCARLATKEGATCGAIDGCAPPLFCNFDPSARTGACYTPPPTNGTCDPTLALPCADERDYCDPTTLQCTRDAPVNAACDQNVYCVAYAECTNGSCVAHPSAGEACVAMGLACLGNLPCTNNQCTVPPPGMVCP
jgi:hypothetical protein